jgi:hypothetical protein
LVNIISAIKMLKYQSLCFEMESKKKIVNYVLIFNGYDKETLKYYLKSEFLQDIINAYLEKNNILVMYVFRNEVVDAAKRLADSMNESMEDDSNLLLAKKERIINANKKRYEREKAADRKRYEKEKAANKKRYERDKAADRKRYEKLEKKYEAERKKKK